MTEREFLEALRLRINQSNDLSSLGYCDFLEPKRYFLGLPEPRIEGTIYFVGDRTGQLFFSLLLPDTCEGLDDITWHELLPPQGVHGWAQAESDRVTIDVNRANA